MQKFAIEVKEVLSRIVDVEADSMEEAVSKVSEMYDAQEISLDYDDYAGYDISPCKDKEKEISHEKNHV